MKCVWEKSKMINIKETEDTGKYLPFNLKV